MTATWMLKSEPGTYSFDDLVRDKTTAWTGVRNYTARIHLKAMKKGDRCFIYHSGGPKEVVGIAEVVAEHHPDDTVTDPEEIAKGWVAVDIRAVEKLKRPVTLAELKKHKLLSQMQLVKLSRLSCSPVTPAEAKALLALASAKPAGGKP